MFGLKKSTQILIGTLSALICLLAFQGCGDFCLFCDGDGSDNGDGDGNGSVQTCESPFLGLEAYQNAASVTLLDTFSQQSGQDDTLSLAVVPGGMSFTFDNGTEQPGDVLLADQQGNTIFVYEFPGPSRRALLTGFSNVSGMALFHKQVESDTFDLLFFTDKRQNTLYIYDLTGTSVPAGVANPFPITNNPIIGSNFLQSPAALAVGEVDSRVVLFILNDNGTSSSVRRLSVDLVTWMPESPATVATSTESRRRLPDIVFFQQTDSLFVSKQVEEGFGVFGWVYRIPDASSRGTAVDLNSATALIEINQNATGLALGLTNTTGTVANLLLLQEGTGFEQVLQFSTINGELESAFTLDSSLQFPRAIEYDCTNRRLLMTDVPLNDDVDRSFFEALPLG